MSDVVNLDVLVVYSAGVAESASVADSFSKHPFLIGSKRANYNLSYSYFLKSCNIAGMTAGFTTSADIIGPGTCSNYWRCMEHGWVKVSRKAKAKHVFDKLAPVTPVRAAERRLLLSDQAIRPFNDRELFRTFFDKLETYKRLPDFAVPTVEVTSSKVEDIQRSIEKLEGLIGKHRCKSDFSSQVVLKDRYGAGGSNVYKMARTEIGRMSTIMSRYKKVKFVLQPFLHFDKGFSYNNTRNSTDLRLIFQNQATCILGNFLTTTDQ